MTPDARRSALRALAGLEVDLLVVGGGVVGAGIALEAVTRGLKVALVESNDWASGASSQSTKLIHGGIRHLEMLDFRLASQALRERTIVARNAPHLVHPVSFLYPLTHRCWERFYAGVGLAMYDTLGYLPGTRRRIPFHRHYGRARTAHYAHFRDSSGVRGAVRYWDYTVDDARYALALVRTAMAHGAMCASQARVVEFLSGRDGRVAGAKLIDHETGRFLTARAKQIAVAVGAWTNDVISLLGGRTAPIVHPSKGVHIVLRKNAIDARGGLLLRTDPSEWKTKSYILVVPWRNRWIVGTTDGGCDPTGGVVPATPEDVLFLVGRLNNILANPVRPRDVVSAYAGVRPLVGGPHAEPALLSRKHVVVAPRPGILLVAGGKYTTYRLMAEDVVNVAMKNLHLPGKASTSRTVELVGARDFNRMWDARHALAQRHQIEVRTMEHLLARYGDLATELLQLVATDRSLGKSIGRTAYIRAEAVYAAAHEAAFHLDDVLLRRTRIGIECWDGGCAVAREVAELMGAVLGWDRSQIESEVRVFVDRASAARMAWSMRVPSRTAP